MEADNIVDSIIEDVKHTKLKCYKCNTKHEFLKRDIPNKCPSCSYSDFWFKPEKERKLFILQSKFLKSNRNPKYLSEMYLPLQDYVRIILLKKLKNKKVLNSDEVDIKVQDTVGKVFLYYTDNKKYGDWKVDNSFYGTISFILLDTLYNHKGRFWERHASLNAVVGKSEGNKKEALDCMISYGYRPMYNVEYDPLKAVLTNDASIVKTLLDLIKSIVQKVEYSKNSKTALYVLVGISYNLKMLKPDYLQLFYDFVGYESETMIKRFMEVIKDYVIMEGERY